MTSKKTSREAPLWPAQSDLPRWAQWLIFAIALLYTLLVLWFLS
jgi:hypothetical protein